VRVRPTTRDDRLISVGFACLGGLIVTYAFLGPLLLERIHFSTSASALNQIRGGDLAALCVVAPLCFAVAGLAWRGHRAAPVLGLAPATFAMYTYSQLILGNEYLDRPGNLERYFPLLLALFVVAAALAVRCWTATPSDELPASSRRLERGSGVLLLLMALFVVVGIHLRTLLQAWQDPPAGSAYLSTPNTFWVVKFYDLGIVVPAAVAVGIGLLLRRQWARKPAYAILGGYVLLAWSVAGMAWTMLANGDSDGSWVQAIAMTCFAGAGTVFAGFLYRPLFQAATDDVPREQDRAQLGPEPLASTSRRP
jgi:hypothetical protein